MTRIAIFSDLHGGADDEMQSAFERFDYVVFLGDGLSKVRYFEYLYPEKYLFVRGNCDSYDETPLRRIVDFDGVRVMMTHGHEEGVRYTNAHLAAIAKREGVQVALYGHTHRAEVVKTDGVLLVNPGSAMPYYDRGGSYAVLTIDNGKYFAEIIKCE